MINGPISTPNLSHGDPRLPRLCFGVAAWACISFIDLTFLVFARQREILDHDDLGLNQSKIHERDRSQEVRAECGRKPGFNIFLIPL
jgi:hypothetical protein